MTIFKNNSNLIEIFISFLSPFYSFFTGYTLSSQKFHVTEGTEWTKEDMGWANIEARDTNAMDIPQVPHFSCYHLDF